MDNNFDNMPEENGLEDSKPVYTDPNADVKEEAEEPVQTVYGYTQGSAPDTQKYAQDTYAGYRQAPRFRAARAIRTSTKALIIISLRTTSIRAVNIRIT